MPRLLLFALLSLTLACTGARPAEQPKPTQPAAAQRVALTGSPNGLWWDAPRQRLLIAEGDQSSLLSWTGGHALRVVAQVPRGEAGLGQMVVASDGTIYVARFGRGTTGGITRIAPDGVVADLAGLLPERKRVGLAIAPPDQLLSTWYTRVGEQVQGGVARVEAGGEQELFSGLQKVVGVLVIEGRVFVSDQSTGQLLSGPLSGPLSPLATLPSIDLLTAGPPGFLFTGGRTGEVYAVSTRSGQHTVIASGFRQVRGVAWDNDAKRLFVVDYDPDKTSHLLHITTLSVPLSQ